MCKKNWGLEVSQESIDNIDPLYLFKNNLFLDNILQMYKLLNDELLMKIYNKIVIRKNKSIKQAFCHNMSYGYGNKNNKCLHLVYRLNPTTTFYAEY